MRMKNKDEKILEGEKKIMINMNRKVSILEEKVKQSKIVEKGGKRLEFYWRRVYCGGRMWS